MTAGNPAKVIRWRPVKERGTNKLIYGRERKTEDGGGDRDMSGRNDAWRRPSPDIEKAEEGGAYAKETANSPDQRPAQPVMAVGAKHSQH